MEASLVEGPNVYHGTQPLLGFIERPNLATSHPLMRIHASHMTQQVHNVRHQLLGKLNFLGLFMSPSQRGTPLAHAPSPHQLFPRYDWCIRCFHQVSNVDRFPLKRSWQAVAFSSSQRWAGLVS
jgi:hypothetical protein